MSLSLFQINFTSSSQLSFMLFLILPTSFFITFLLLIIKQSKKPVNTRNLPPGPKKLPLIGNLHQLGNLLHKSLQALSHQHGPLMFLQLGSIPTLVISSADTAREVFKNHDLIFSGRAVSYAGKKISYGCCDVTFAPYGEYWREVRKIVILELLTAKRAQSFEVVRDEEVTLMLDTIAHSSNSSPIDLSHLMLVLANNVICRVTFGKKYDGTGGDKFNEMLRETQHLVGGFWIADFFPWMEWLNKFNGLEARLEKNFRELDKFYDKAIEEHRDVKRLEPEHEDLVDVLLRLQKDPNQKIALTNEQIKGVLTDMFIAGTDTSSATVVWTMAELIRNPSVMRKAQAEVRETIKGKGKVEESDLSKLMYLKSVIKESLRLRPPVPLSVPRETTENCMINGYEIPAKTRVFVDVKSIAMDLKYWENPNEFQPERFLDSLIDFKGQNFEFLPFGVGRRGCPGINFAILVIELVLANMLYCFDWKLPDGMKIEDLDMEEDFGITMHKKVPLCLVATPVIP